jgi:hypothetical protein
MGDSQASSISNCSEDSFIASPVLQSYRTGTAQDPVVTSILQFTTELLGKSEEISIPGSTTSEPEKTVP